MARFKKSTLSEEAKRRNVAAGLTPTGRVKVKRLSTKGIDKQPEFPQEDYRCTGFNFTPARKNAFLEVIRKQGNRAEACREIGIAQATVSRHRTEDPAFRDAMDEAFRQHATIYINEMRRRGVEGVQKAVYGSQGPGAGSGVIGWVTEYSDRLLLELAKKYDPDFRPTLRTESKVHVTQTNESLGLENLSPESQEDLRRILEREALREPDDGEAGE